MCSINQNVLDRLGDCVAELAAVPAVERGAAGSDARIRELMRVRAQLDAVLMGEVAVFDSASGYAEDGSATAAGWLRATTRLARREASTLVHEARGLRELSATSAAMRSGAIGRAHAAEILKAQTRSGLGVVDFEPYEEILVELAASSSPDEVRAAAHRLVEVEAPERDKELVVALADRRFALHEVGDLVKVDAMIDKVTAAALIKGVEAKSRRTSEDPRSWHERRADAFSEIVILGLESGQLPQQGRTKPHLNVTLTIDQLTGVDGAGPLLQRFGRIPRASAQRLSCDAVMTRFITDPHGEVLDVGRACRHTNSGLNKAIAHMYDACAYPNCSTPVTQCDIHHVWWWSLGGPTDRWNLLPLCKQHHIFVHENGYYITTALDPGGGARRGPSRWSFISPRGTPIPDHRKTLGHYVEQLTLIPDPSPV